MQKINAVRKGYSHVASKSKCHIVGKANCTAHNADLRAPNLQEYEVCMAQTERDLDARFKPWHMNRAVDLQRHDLLFSRRIKKIASLYF